MINNYNTNIKDELLYWNIPIYIFGTVLIHNIIILTALLKREQII